MIKEEKELDKIIKETIAKVFPELTPKEQDVLIMRWGLEDGIHHTIEEVGKKFGITRERVRQIQEKALEKLKTYNYDTSATKRWQKTISKKINQ